MDFSQQQLGLLAAFAILAGAVAFAPQSPLSAASVDRIEFDSNSEFFDGEVLKIEYDASTTASSLNTEISESEIERETSRETDQDLSIDVSDAETKIRYDIEQSGKYSIQTVVQNQFDRTNLQQAKESARNQCYDLNGDGVIQIQTPNNQEDYYEAVIGEKEGVFVTSRNVACFQIKQPFGQAADIGNGDVETSADFRVNADGKRAQEATISNSQIGEGKVSRIGDNVLVEWKSNLQTGEAKPRTSDELALYQGSFDGWKIIQRSSYNDYETFVETEASELLDPKGVDGRELGLFNEKAREAAEAHTDPDLDSDEFTSTNFDSATIVHEPQDPVAYPEFDVYVDGADYLEVEKPVAEPRIVSITGTEVPETGTGTVEVDVQNTASTEGSFFVRVSDTSSEFTTSDLSREITLESGESRELGFDIAFSGDGDEKEVEGSVTVEVENADGSSTARASTDVTGVNANTCGSAPGERFKDIRNGQTQVRLCDKDGVGSTLVETCSSDERVEVIDGKLQCFKPDTGGGSGGSDGGDNDGGQKSDDCQIKLFEAPTGQTVEFTNPLCAVQNAVDNALGSTLGLFDLIVSAVAGLVGFGLASRDLGDFVAPTFDEATRLGESQVRLVLGLVALIAVGYLTFTVISNIFVKIGLVAAGIAYAYIKSLIPGV